MKAEHSGARGSNNDREEKDLIEEPQKQIENALLCGHSNISLFKGRVEVVLRHWEVNRRLTRKQQEAQAAKHAEEIMRILSE